VGGGLLLGLRESVGGVLGVLSLLRVMEGVREPVGLPVPSGGEAVRAALPERRAEGERVTVPLGLPGTPVGVRVGLLLPATLPVPTLLLGELLAHLLPEADTVPVVHTVEEGLPRVLPELLGEAVRGAEGVALAQWVGEAQGVALAQPEPVPPSRLPLAAAVRLRVALAQPLALPAPPAAPPAELPVGARPVALRWGVLLPV
jgi:hypothetical protein